MTAASWFYVETIDQDGHGRAICIRAAGRSMACREARAAHVEAHVTARRIEVMMARPVSAEKAADIRAYMARGDWHAWPLGVRVPA